MIFRPELTFLTRALRLPWLNREEPCRRSDTPTHRLKLCLADTLEITAAGDHLLLVFKLWKPSDAVVAVPRAPAAPLQSPHL